MNKPVNKNARFRKHSPSVTPSREVALTVIRSVLEHGAYSNLSLDAAIRKKDMDSRDKALATQIIYGVLRNITLLTEWIKTVVTRPLEDIEPLIMDILLIGAYQLKFLDRVPAAAAVNEACEMAPQRARSFVNGVLRRLAEQGKKPVPIPKHFSATNRIATQYSHPEWIVERWIKHFGEQTAEKMCEWDQHEPPASVRVNPLLAKRDQIIKAFAERGISIKPSVYSEHGLIFRSLDEALWSKEFRKGQIVIQSEASQIICRLLKVEPDLKVLEIGAAPGTKTTYLAGLMENIGKIVALDKHAGRINLLNEAVRRQGIEIVKTIDVHDDVIPPEAGRHFDRALVDAPCTGLGTLAKHPEIRWRRKPEDVQAMAAIQLALLQDAALRLRAGGILIYAVCTLTQEENLDVVRAFLKEHRNFAVDDLKKDLSGVLEPFRGPGGTFLSLPPKTGTEGFFACRFLKGM